MALEVKMVPSEGQLQHVASLLEDVCIAIGHPSSSLRRYAPDVAYVDAITALRGLGDDASGTRFVPSPTMLEAMWHETQAAVAERPGASVALHSLSALAVYNGPEEALRFTRSLARRIGDLGGELTVLVTDSSEGRHLASRL